MKNHTNIIFISSLVVATLASSFFFWLLSGIATNMDEARNIKLELEEARKKNNYARVLSSLLDNTKGEQKRLDTLFVDGEEVVNLLQEIERLGTYAGVAVGVASIRDDGNQILVTTSYSGSYARLRHFVALAENIPYAVFINSVRFTKQKKATQWGGSLEFVILKADNQ